MISHKININDFSVTLEQQEAAYFADYFRKVNRQVREQLGLGYHRIGSAELFYASQIDILAFNRVIGPGLQRPLKPDLLDDMIAIYRKACVPRFFIQLSPHASPKGADRILSEKGFRYYNDWAKFYQTISDFPDAQSALRIEQIDRNKRDLFAGIILTAFDWPKSLQPLIANPVGSAGWKHYLVYKDRIPIACAALYTRGDYATLVFAATLPEYRGLGSQSALISRRFRDAADAGCKWMFTETAVETAQRAVASFRNMKRSGFQLAYLRPNYLYEFEPAE